MSNVSSNFEFEFLVSLLYSISRISIFDSNFEFKCLDFSIRSCRRNFRVVALFDFSNFNFRFECVVEIFDSSFEFKFLEFSCRISNSSFSFRCSIRLLESDRQIRFLEFQFSIRICRRKFRCSIRLLEIDRQIRLLEVRLLESSPLNFEFVLIYSTSRTLMIIKFSNLSSKLSFASRILHLSS